MRIGHFVPHRMTSNLMPPPNDALEKLNVLRIPFDFSPIRVFMPVDMNRRSVGRQKESSVKPQSVENGKGLFKLASQPVVEGERNKC